MKGRCESRTVHDYPQYGGRGIRVCDRWRHSFLEFIEDMGTRPGPGYAIERIDSDGDYEPENCRWAAPDEQSNVHDSRDRSSRDWPLEQVSRPLASVSTAGRDELHQCMCRALLLKPRAVSGILNEKMVRKIETKVQRSWHRLARGLTEQGWPSGVDPRTADVMEQCPSSLISSGYSQGVRPCRRRRVCPFCWTRLITAKALFAVNQALTRLRVNGPPPTVIRFEYRIETVADLVSVVDSIRDTQLRRTEVSLLKGQGAYLCHRVVPYVSSQKLGFYRAGLVLNGRMPDHEVANTTFELLEDPKPDKLLVAVADVTRYPLAFFEAEPAAIKYLLEALKGVHMTSVSGGKRGG